ncbi:MAG: MOP flippase family protein [Gammaproteobacteria bacterium]|nr:MOP flippase family protein [Gammaproteobacteria bacterium]
MTMSLFSKTAHSVRWTTALTTWDLLIGFAQIAILAHFFHPGEFGAIAILTLLLGVANVFVRVGFSDSVIAIRDLGDRQLSTLYWLNILCAVTAYALIWISADYLSKFVTVPSFPEQVRAISLTLIVGALAVQFEALLRKDLAFRLLAILGILRSGIGLILLIAALNKDWNIWGYVAATIGAQVTYSGLLLFQAYRKGWLPSFIVVPQEATELIRFGAYRIGAAFLNNVSNRVDQMAIAGFLGPVELGYYNMAHSIAMKPFQKIGPILSRVSFPIFASISNDIPRMLRGYRMGVRMVLFVNAPLLIGYIAVAPDLIPLYLGSNWQPTIAISQVLALYALLRTAGNINIGLILARGKYKWPLYWNAFMCALLPLTIYLASIGGTTILEIAVLLLIVQAGVLLVSYFLFPRKLLLPFGVEYLADLAKPVIVSFLMYVVVLAIGYLLPLGGSAYRLVVMVASGGLAYLGFSYLLQLQNIKAAIAVISGRHGTSRDV